MKEISLIRLMLLKCAGADVETLRQCTSAEITKYVIYGTCVLIPTVFAIFSGGYSVFLMTSNFYASALVALLWSWGIFTIDRAVVASTRPGQFTLGVLGRITLGIIISFTIAEPLTLRFFQDEIEQKRTEILQKKTDSLDRVLASDIKNIDLAKNNQKGKIDSQYAKYETEVDGGTGQRGRGTAAITKYQKYQQDSLQFIADESERETQRDTLRHRASRARSSLIKMDADGLLGRLTVLGILMDKDKHVWWAVWLVRAFFLSIEIIPILVKAGSPADEDLYHDINTRNSQSSKDVHNNLKKRKDEIFELEQLLVLRERKDKLEIRLKKGTAIDAHRDQDFIMFKVKQAGDQKIKIENRIIRTIKNEVFREQLLARLQKSYDLYANAMDSLVEEMAKFYTDINTQTDNAPNNNKSKP